MMNLIGPQQLQNVQWESSLQSYSAGLITVGAEKAFEQVQKSELIRLLHRKDRMERSVYTLHSEPRLGTNPP
jgi:hypothetical protein